MGSHFSQHQKNVIGRKKTLPHFCIVNGGNKRIAAKRYVHGIIQIQVREQVLPLSWEDLLNLKKHVEQNVKAWFFAT